MSITMTFPAFDFYDLDARPGRGALVRALVPVLAGVLLPAAAEVVPGLGLTLAVAKAIQVGVRVTTTG